MAARSAIVSSMELLSFQWQVARPALGVGRIQSWCKRDVLVEQEEKSAKR
jgi:hypothetical protein